MTDDKTKRGGQDRARINIHEDYEVRDWADKFGVTHQQLIEAVQVVGDRAEDVEKHLKRHGGGS
jgi:hypothetical protein